jgi:hypothetical protein
VEKIFDIYEQDQPIPQAGHGSNVRVLLFFSFSGLISPSAQAVIVLNVTAIATAWITCLEIFIATSIKVKLEYFQDENSAGFVVTDVWFIKKNA